MFYVYALLDTSNPGEYIYDDIKFDYEPFYIGKGSEKRVITTISENRNSFKKNKIESLKKNNLEIKFIKINEYLIEDDAFDFEVYLISKIGRRNLGMGPLTNLTDGGEGRKNVIVSEETKQKISKTKKSQKLNNKHTEETKKNLSIINKGEFNPFYGKNHKEETKELQSLRVSGMNHPMFRKNHTEEAKDKIRSSNKLKELIDSNKKVNCKPVLQFSLDGEFINEFLSIKEASIETGCSESIIGKCCRGLIKNPRTYFFKFKDQNSLILNNSFKIKIGDIFMIKGQKYKLLERFKKTCLLEKDGVIFNIRKKDYPKLFEKIKLNETN
jgi:group I intron endonuclease